MKPSRKIAHKVADVIVKSANNSLDPQRMRSMYANSAQLHGTHAAELDPEKSGAILTVWIEAIVEHISSKRDGIISDYVLDLIESIQKHLESVYTDEELTYMVSVVENPAFQKLWNDKDIFGIVADAKETFNAHIVKEMQSEECVNIMQKKLHELFTDNGFDDNFHTSG